MQSVMVKSCRKTVGLTNRMRLCIGACLFCDYKHYSICLDACRDASSHVKVEECMDLALGLGGQGQAATSGGRTDRQARGE